MEKTEDQTAPVSKLEVAAAIERSDEGQLYRLVRRVLEAINERRDSYNGVVSSMIYLIDGKDEKSITALRDGLQEYITQRPMTFAGKTFLSKALYRLISEQPCFIEDLFEHLIETSDTWKVRISPEHDQILRIQIMALKAIKQAEHSKLGRPTRLSKERIEQLCGDSLRWGDEATRIDTVGLVLESRSTTRVLEANELDTFKRVFVDAICLQDAALRQVFIALTNKVVRRLSDSYKAAMRDTKRFADPHAPQAIAERYRQFLNWLIDTCLDSNYCNAYFGSFVLTISTLKLIILHVGFALTPPPPSQQQQQDGGGELPVEQQFRSRRCYDSILSCLGDSFEENKVLALSLLLSLPYNERFFAPSNLSTFESIAYDLIDSINPAHSLTCQYVFKLLIGLEERGAALAKEASSGRASRNRLLLKHLNRLLDQVEGSVATAQDNFTMALKGKPVYPKLTCIRALLEDVDINDLDSDRELWLKLCHRVVNVSIEACQAVSTIVCNLNPETIGHLPMDLKPVDPESLAKSFNLSVNVSDADYSTITSQMLLISGWKTIKECSLSLGTLCVRFWWPKDGIKMKKEKFPGLKSEPILARADILKILDYFDHYLRNLRHRGAFEQAYNGFIMVTRRIWHDIEFREQMIETLRQIMSDFRAIPAAAAADGSEREPSDTSRAEHLKAYVTRRSAGLPFIVQAILISEHKQESATLNWVMASLFEVLEDERCEEYQRIHCMNILRALIKEHHLGDKVLGHVGRTLSITLRAFRSDSFPIRNCANMLLKAMVDRTFGVNRLKDEIHRRNQLSFERFFSEFPNLFGEMVEYLKTDVADKRYLASIHSVLIVLSRLKASTNPGPAYTFDKVIKPFIPLATRWAQDCPDYTLRQVAARIAVQLSNYSTVQLSPLVDTQSVQDELEHACAFDFDNLNRSHGCLALMRYLTESDSSLFRHYKQHMWLRIQLAQEIIFAREKNLSPLRLNLIALLESWFIVCGPPPTRYYIAGRWPEHMIEFIVHDEQHPLAEQTLFRYIAFQLAEDLIGYRGGEVRGRAVECHAPIARFVFGPTGRTRICTHNLQAAIIRLLRQICCRDDDVVDEIHRALDLDSTAAHETLFDRLKYRKEEGLECAKLEAYLSRESGKPPLNAEQREILNCYIRILVDFSQFGEFQAVPNESSGSRSSSSSASARARRSNTPRSIELLAFACKTNGFKDFHQQSIIWRQPDESEADKMRSLYEFISDLSDCDVKSLAVIHAGQLLRQADLTDAAIVEAVHDFSRLIAELAEGYHSFVVRRACCEALRMAFARLSSLKEVGSRAIDSLVNFMATIIKLSKDTESEIRSLSLKVISSIEQAASPQSEPASDRLSLRGGSRLDPLIRLIADGTIFDPNDLEQLNKALELLALIMFDHCCSHEKKNNGDGDDDDSTKERLFDKTKLNTFADHIAATGSAFGALYRIFRRRHKLAGRPVSLSSLKLPSVIFAELNSGLKLKSKSKTNITGDYSWRLKQRLSTLPLKSSPAAAAAAETIDNNQVIGRLLQEILESFEYFSRGYWNILTDTEYIYHELSLYRRLAIVKFVLDCLDHQLEDERAILTMVHKTLTEIVDESCATTILTKCIDLLECSVEPL